MAASIIEDQSLSNERTVLFFGSERNTELRNLWKIYKDANKVSLLRDYFAGCLRAKKGVKNLDYENLPMIYANNNR